MIKVKDGDIDKLGMLFERYKKPLFGFFYGMVRDGELADDLVQNVFVRILKYRYLFRGDGEFKTWLFHIARNVRHDHFRKNKMRNHESLTGLEERLTTGENRGSEIEQDDTLKMSGLALERLPPDKREVLLLSKFQEKKYKEIGEILGCSESAVKVKVFRALQELRQVYKELERQL